MLINDSNLGVTSLIFVVFGCPLGIVFITTFSLDLATNSDRLLSLLSAYLITAAAVVLVFLLAEFGSIGQLFEIVACVVVTLVFVIIIAFV